MSKHRLIEIVNDQKKKGLSKKRLANLLKRWQEKLLLSDWEINIKIVDFKRKDFRQSGDFIADLKNKKATIFMTVSPFMKDRNTIAKEEEKTLVHELIHICLWDLDNFIEKTIFKKHSKNYKFYNIYMEKLENLVEKLTGNFLKNRKG